MTLSAQNTGALLEHLFGVLTDDLALPLRSYEKCTPTGKSIHDRLDTLVAEYPDFVHSFIVETREFNERERKPVWSNKKTLGRLDERLYEFLDRVGREQSPSSRELSEEPTEYDYEVSERGVPKEEQDIIVISDDDLESLAPDSPTYQRYLDLAHSYRVKSEVISEPKDDGGDGSRKRKENEEDGEDDEDEDEGSGPDSESELSDTQYQYDKCPSPASSYTTAHNSPVKRKPTEDDLIAESPISSKRRLADSGSPDNLSPVALILSASSTLPSTPLARPDIHTGATNALDKLRVESSKSPDTPPPLILDGGAQSLTEWNVEHPFSPPPRSEEFVEILPKNPYQAALNARGVNYCVQWEVERHVHNMEGEHRVSWGDFQLSDINKLVGAAADAIPRIPSILRHVIDRKTPQQTKGDAHIVPSPALCAEMDMEETSIRAGDLRGVGDDDPAWSYGGKLVFAITVRYKQGVTRPLGQNGPADNPFGAQIPEWPFTFHLSQVDQPGKSTRLARRFGSRRLLTIRFSQVPFGVRPKFFLMLRGRAFVLFGRVFRVLFIAPDSNSGVVVETNEDPPHYPRREAVEPPMPSFLEMLQRYNALSGDPAQAMAKWASRLQLLLSDSIPGLHVPYDMIQVAPDIVCASAKNPEHPRTEETLTDGCGLMSEDLARRLVQQPTFAHLASRPFSLQMRIDGAKGVLCIMSPGQQEQYPGKDIVLRPSMIKSCPDDRFKFDRSLYTLDVLKVDPMKVGSNLSSEAIIIMVHNGVPAETILDMAQTRLEEIKLAFLPSPHAGESEQDMTDRLVTATYRFGGVGAERRKREMVARGKSAKVAGLVSGHFADEEEEQKVEEASMAEKLYEMLLAGFKPSIDVTDGVSAVSEDGCGYALSKLRTLVRLLSNKAASDLSIPVPQSATAFIVPDTLGVLAPDEVFVSFASEEPLDPVSRRRVPILESDVLVYRSPSKLPTDVRRLKAVVRPELFHLRDCIVLSANSELCTASPASFLGGGDYDGDTATIIWDQALVQPFTNAPEALASQPADFGANFVKQVTSVADFISAVGDDEARLITNLQHFLLGSLLDEKLTGMYSDLHTNSVYMRGCDHPASLRLAHMFCSVLDARKSGLSVPRHIRAADQRANAGEVQWRNFKKGKDDTQHNVVYAQRPEALGPFIMDAFIAIVSRKQHDILASFPDPASLSVSEGDFTPLAKSYAHILDQRLRCRLTIHDTEFGQQVNTLARHVNVCSTLYTHIWSRGDRTPIVELYKLLQRGDKLPPSRGRDDAKLKSQRVLDLALVWREGLLPEHVPLLVPLDRPDVLAELKVSCAVHTILARNRRAQVKVPFELDLQAMCDLKARRAGPTRAVPAAVAGRLRPAFAYVPPAP